MNILITGGSGFIGKYLLRELSKSNFVFELSRTSNLKFDLSKGIPNFLFKAELVVHAAGLAHKVPSNIKELNLFNKINVIGTQNLLNAIEINGIPESFVFISSVAVYGITEGVLINEVSKLNAIDAYGRSKIEAEAILLKWCQVNNVRITILRLPLVVGEDPPGNLGAMIKCIKKGFYFNIAGGLAKKSMVLANDVARFVLKSSEVGGIYNLTDGYHPSFAELSRHISRQLGKRVPRSIPFWLAKLLALGGDLLFGKAPLNSIKLNKIITDLTYDDSNAREAFGWNPTSVLDGFRISEKNS